MHGAIDGKADLAGRSSSVVFQEVAGSLDTEFLVLCARDEFSLPLCMFLSSTGSWYQQWDWHQNLNRRKTITGCAKLDLVCWIFAYECRTVFSSKMVLA